MKTRKALSLLVTLAMLIGLVTIPAFAADEATEFDLGEFTWSNPDNPTSQRGWVTDGYTDGETIMTSDLTIDYVLAAQYLILDMSAAPVGGMQLIWQGDAVATTDWNQVDILSGMGVPDAEKGVTLEGTSLKIELAKALKTYDDFKNNTMAKIIIAYYSSGIDDLGITRAYLQGDFSAIGAEPGEGEEGTEPGEGEEHGEGEEPGEGEEGTEPEFGEGEYDVANFEKVVEYADDFNDLNWAAASIIEAYEYGIVTGTGTTGIFNPTGPLTVQTALIIGGKIHNIYATGESIDFGADTDDWNEEVAAGISYAIDAGLIAEDDALLADPTKTVTRAEAVHLWSKVLLDKDLAVIAEDVSFEDVTEETEYYEDIMKLAKAGIVTGNNGLFTPEESFTRGASAALFMNLITIPSGTDDPADPGEEDPADPGEDDPADPGDVETVAEFALPLPASLELNAGTQYSWVTDGDADNADKVFGLTEAILLQATGIVLEMSEAPSGGNTFHWQQGTADVAMGWEQVDFSNDLYKDGKLTLNFADLGVSFAEGTTAARFGLGLWEGQWPVVTKAYLIGEFTVEADDEEEPAAE